MRTIVDWLFVLVAFIFARAGALDCYQCSQARNVNDCNTSRTCLTGEKCGNLTSAASLIGKRQLECHTCCSRDLCNQALCQGLRSSNCADDEQEDCAKLNSLFGVCNDVPHARLICPRYCNLCDIVDGAWSVWSQWSDCDVTCANGTKSRVRSCTNPAPTTRGEHCKGPDHESTVCTNKKCPVHGGWTSWTVWGSCSVTCDVGMQRRDRSCSNPSPSADGDYCHGRPSDDMICFENACANGGWSSWSGWGQCSATCGTGLKSRQRNCDNPKPSLLGTNCAGSAENVNICSERACNALSSAFSVSTPNGYSNSTLHFSQSIYHIGSDFNMRTGVFTCTIPGVYVFTVTMVKKRILVKTVDFVQCQVFQNNSAQIKARVDPTDDNTDIGNAAITETVVLHLNLHDRVYLGDCTAITSMESWTSFTGFLLTPDK